MTGIAMIHSASASHDKRRNSVNTKDVGCSIAAG